MGRAKLKTLKETTLKSFFEVLKICHITRDWYNYNQVGGTITFYNGSEILLKDLFAYPSDPDFDELGSLEITGAFIDEASQITRKAKNILKSRIRYKLDEFELVPKLLLTCNPTRNFLYTEYYKPFIDKALPKDRAFVHALLSDNPYITKHYKTNLLGLDKESRSRLLFGNWNYSDDPTQLCEFDKIVDLWTNTHVETGRKYITSDIARFGKDKTDIWVWEGLRVIEIKTLAKSSIPDSVNAIKKLKEKHKVPMSNISADEQGVGGGVVDLLPGCYGFIANAKPINTGARQNYANLKAQCSFLLSEYVNNAKMWIRTEDYKDEIIEELEQVKKKTELTDGKLDVIKKDDIKEMIGRSPDHQDNMLQRIRFEIGEVDYFS